MPNDLTPSETARKALELAEAATIGPWMHWVVTTPPQKGPDGEEWPLVHGSGPPHQIKEDRDGSALKAAFEDMKFIAFSRLALPLLAKAYLNVIAEASASFAEIRRCLDDVPCGDPCDSYGTCKVCVARGEAVLASKHFPDRSGEAIERLEAKLKVAVEALEGIEGLGSVCQRKGNPDDFPNDGSAQECPQCWAHEALSKIRGEP